MATRTRVLCVLSALISLAMAAPAAAQVRRSNYRDKGGFHEFRDDPLHSRAASAHGSRIQVRGVPPRVMLLRPRASFVSEMLKSVETM